MRKHYLLLAVLMLYYTVSLFAQTTEPYNWSNVAMGGGGFVSGIITSKTQPGLIYARTDVGGAYRWDSANSRWIPLLDFANEGQQGYFGVLSIAIDEKSPSIVYMQVGISYWNNGASYILRSADYGATFTSVNVTSQFKINGNANGRENGERLQVDPVSNNILYCGSQSNGLFKSTDSGSSWTNMPGLAATTTTNGDGINLVTLDTTSTAVVNGVKQTQRMFVGVSRIGLGKNLYRSDDGGTTFTAIKPPNPVDTSLMPHKAVLSNGYLYVTYANGGGPASISTAEPCTEGQIWRYKVADGSWTNITPIQNGSAVTTPWCGISIDPGNPNRIIVSTTNRYSAQYKNSSGAFVYGDKIFLTTDGGATWTDIVGRGFSINPNGIPWIAGASIHWGGSIQFDPSNTNRVFIGSGDGVFANNDITNTAGVWNFVAQGVEETVPKNMISINGGGPFSAVIGDYGGFTNSDPTAYGSRIQPSMGSTGAMDYAVTSKKVVLVNTNLYYSTDQGYTFTVSPGTAKGSNGQVGISADGNIILHCPNGSTATYRTTDNGATWTTCSGLTVNTKPVADGLNASKFYAYDGSTGKLFVSTDAGLTFSAAPNTTSKTGSSIIRTIPGREGSVWIALGNSGLVYTDNGATTAFTNVPKVTYCEAVGIGKAAAVGGYETIFIWGTVNGVLGLHRSTDKGANWTRVNDDNHQFGGPGNAVMVLGDMNTYGRVYMSTAGRGVACGTVIPPKTPTDITLSSTDIYQNNAVGAIVGNLSSVAADANSTYTYTLVNGTGGADNGAFSIAGVQLKAAVVFNSVAKSVYNIRIRTTTNDGYTFEKAFVINIRSAFLLPATNFKVSATNETCSDNNDGKINITAVQNLNYKATVTVNNVSTNYPFTTALEVSPLNAGSYTVCITVAGQTDYKQCYDLVISEPKPLSVYSTVNLKDKNVVLNLGGAASYQVELNGIAQTVTSDTVKLNLSSGRNDILVSTDKDCQGAFKKTIYLEDGKKIYPVPFDNTLFVNMGTDPSKSVSINLYSTYGVLAYSKQIEVQDAVVQLNLTDVKAGIYVIKIKTDQGESSTKIFKK